MHPHKAAAESSGKAKHRTILKACGGMASGGHTDAKEDKKLFKSMMKEHDSKVHGKASGGRLDRYARGGRTKSHTHVNVVVAPQGGKEPVPVPMPGGAPPMPPRPPVAPPMAGPPGGLPGGGPPMPMRAKGGRINTKPEHPKPAYPKPKYTKTNKDYPIEDGAISGPGRLEKIEAYGSKKKASGGAVTRDEGGSVRFGLEPGGSYDKSVGRRMLIEGSHTPSGSSQSPAEKREIQGKNAVSTYKDVPGPWSKESRGGRKARG